MRDLSELLGELAAAKTHEVEARVDLTAALAGARRATRRRRTVRAVGTGVAAASVLVAVAVGSWAVGDRREPEPAVTSSPTSSPTPSATPTPSPTPDPTPSSTPVETADPSGPAAPVWPRPGAVRRAQDGVTIRDGEGRTVVPWTVLASDRAEAVEGEDYRVREWSDEFYRLHEYDWCADATDTMHLRLDDGRYLGTRADDAPCPQRTSRIGVFDGTDFTPWPSTQELLPGTGREVADVDRADGWVAWIEESIAQQSQGESLDSWAVFAAREDGSEMRVLQSWKAEDSEDAARDWRKHGASDVTLLDGRVSWLVLQDFDSGRYGVMSADLADPGSVHEVVAGRIHHLVAGDGALVGLVSDAADPHATAYRIVSLTADGRTEPLLDVTGAIEGVVPWAADLGGHHTLALGVGADLYVYDAAHDHLLRVAGVGEVAYRGLAADDSAVVWSDGSTSFALDLASGPVMALGDGWGNPPDNLRWLATGDGSFVRMQREWTAVDRARVTTRLYELLR
ncbi:hypothetical protein [Cellulomonas massiliensis]|uniref:hypothetical protein n=1 Tax=Cellulomonas massiliensis TaxID=1465811 RepID=UPI0002EF9150|nr:hypothetical protein [Cellulomonas massiliensis]